MKEDLKEKKDSVINNTSKRKPQVFIVGDSMTRDLKGWLMARDKAVKVYTFPGASCEDMENYLVPLMNRKPDQILLLHALVPPQILQIRFVIWLPE